MFAGYVPIPSFLQGVVSSLPVLNDVKYLDNYSKTNPQLEGKDHLEGQPSLPSGFTITEVITQHLAVCITPIIRMPNGLHKRVLYKFLEYIPLLDSSCMVR